MSDMDLSDEVTRALTDAIEFAFTHHNLTKSYGPSDRYGVTEWQSSKRLNRDKYNRCVINGGYIDECCINADGFIIVDDEGYPEGCSWYSMTDPGKLEDAPQPPGPTEPPPVVQNPLADTSNPLIPVPRGPNSGTLG